MENKSIIWLLVILFIVLIGAGIFGYIYYNKYQDTNTELNTSQLLVIQNEKYHKEILNQKEDSIQTLSGLVIDLNNEKNKVEGEYNAQVSNLKIQIKSLKVRGETVSITGEDSGGTYLDIPFNGKVSIAAYEGYTRHYYGLNRSYYDIDINLDPINLSSRFYIDNEGIWKIETKSLTRGITIQADYQIDSTFYSVFKNEDSLPQREEESLWKFKIKAGIIGSWNSNDFYKNKPILVSTEISYDFIYAEYLPLHKYIVFGASYDLTPSFNAIKNIFSFF